jgi:hypothetical protein
MSEREYAAVKSEASALIASNPKSAIAGRVSDHMSHALIAETGAVIAHKQIYRVMKVRDLLLDGETAGAERRHDGRITVDKRYRHGTPTASRLAVTTVRRSGSPSRAV